MRNELEQLCSALQNQTGHSELKPQLVSILERLHSNAENEVISWHILGFIHVKLATLDQKTLRLHIWPIHERHKEVPDWPVHKHSWPLLSNVLCGEVNNQIYSVTNSMEEGTHRLYSVEYQNGKSFRVATDQLVTCILEASYYHKQGEYYTVASDEFHTTKVSDDVFAATLVVTLAGQSSEPLVVGDVSAGSSYLYERQSCPTSLAKSALQHLLNELGK